MYSVRNQSSAGPTLQTPPPRGPRPYGCTAGFPCEALEPRRLLAATLVKDVTPTEADGYIDQPTVAGDLVFFVQDSTSQGGRLWKTDGTTAGTALLKDPFPANTNNPIVGLTARGRQVYFFTSDPSGPGLWTSDGTAG